MECLLPYLCMATVPHIMVGLERMLDYRGVGLGRFHCIMKLINHKISCEDKLIDMFTNYATNTTHHNYYGQPTLDGTYWYISYAVSSGSRTAYIGLDTIPS